MAYISCLHGSGSQIHLDYIHVNEVNSLYKLTQYRHKNYKYVIYMDVKMAQGLSHNFRHFCRVFNFRAINTTNWENKLDVCQVLAVKYSADGMPISITINDPMLQILAHMKRAHLSPGLRNTIESANK